MALREFCLVVGVQSHYHIVIVQDASDLRVAPDAGFHLPAVHASVSGDVHEYRLPLRLGGGQPFLKGGVSFQALRQVKRGTLRGAFACRESGLRSIFPKDKVLGFDRRQVSGEGLQGRSPHSGYEIYHKRKVYDGKHKSSKGYVLKLRIVFETQFSKQVEAQEGEYHNPKGKVYLPVKDAPVICLVRRAEELESQRQFNESKDNLDTVQPSAALWQVLQKAWEKSQEGERKGECNGEGQHCDHRCPELSLGRLDEHGTHDWAGAGERYQHKGEGHKEHACKASLVRILVAPVYYGRRELYLERSKERCREQHKYHKEQQVWQPMC